MFQRGGSSSSSSSSSSGWSRGRAISSRTKWTGSRQTLRPRLLAIAGQPGCKQQRIYGAFHHTEATSELCLPPVSYEASILVLGHREIRLRYTNITRDQHRGGLSPTGVGLHPGPGLFGGTISVQTRPGGCLPGPARTLPF